MIAEMIPAKAPLSLPHSLPLSPGRQDDGKDDGNDNGHTPTARIVVYKGQSKPAETPPVNGYLKQRVADLGSLPIAIPSSPRTNAHPGRRPALTSDAVGTHITSSGGFGDQKGEELVCTGCVGALALAE